MRDMARDRVSPRARRSRLRSAWQRNTSARDELESIGCGEDADDPPALDDDSASKAFLRHLLRHLLQRHVGTDGIRVLCHRVLDDVDVEVDARERLEEVKIALRQDPDELAALEHGQMTDLVFAHHPMCNGERLLATDRHRLLAHRIFDAMTWRCRLFSGPVGRMRDHAWTPSKGLATRHGAKHAFRSARAASPGARGLVTHE